MACDKPVSCGRHKCIKSCHEGECAKPNELCRQKCTKSRSECDHICAAPCHEGDCPEIPCKEQVNLHLALIYHKYILYNFFIRSKFNVNVEIVK